MADLKLANLVIAGVSRSGTTSLFTYLGQHPDICPAGVKETRYFSHIRYGGELPPIEEYAAHFSACGGERYRLEATPGYVWGGQPTIRALTEILDDPRIIISLRNPIARLRSAYQLRAGRDVFEESFSFENYVDRSEEIFRTGGVSRPENKMYGALARGFYADYLGDWLEAFGDRLRIVFFERLAADPVAVVEELCDWLGIDRAPVAAMDFGNRNPSLRNPRLHRIATALGRAARPVIGEGGRLQGVARRAYYALNSTPTRGDSLAESTRARLERMYADSNRRLAADLRAAGYRELPRWLLNAETQADARGHAGPQTVPESGTATHGGQ